MMPGETLVVTFFAHPCLAIRSDDGTIYMSLRDLCDVVGLRLNGQLRRLRADVDLRDGLATFRVLTAGGMQDQEFLILEFVPTWVTSVSRARATPVAQERLRYLRLFTIRETYNAFARTAGLPEGDSRQIEDMRDLAHFDDAMTDIADRQRQIEESQNKARSAWRELDARVRSLEEKIGGSITNSQRGTIYQLVQAWAGARIAHDPNLTRQEAFQSCWAAIKSRYTIAKYEQLPATQYADCVAYIKAAYTKVTGSDLDLPEQRSLDLD